MIVGVILLLFAISLAYVIYNMETAPDGYEDETGFHYGTKERKQ